MDSRLRGNDKKWSEDQIRYSETGSSYKDLIVYQKAYKLALLVYSLTERFPYKERFGLTSQMRRCGVSIPSNIAEGYRRGKKEYIQFLRIAHGSCAELETQLMLSRDLGSAPDESLFQEVYPLQDEVSRLLRKLIYKMGNGDSK